MVPSGHVEVTAAEGKSSRTSGVATMSMASFMGVGGKVGSGDAPRTGPWWSVESGMQWLGETVGLWRSFGAARAPLHLETSGLSGAAGPSPRWPDTSIRR